jgi:hypothetical protein
VGRSVDEFETTRKEVVTAEFKFLAGLEGPRKSLSQDNRSTEIRIGDL